MLFYILKRIVYIAVILAVMSVLIFAITQIMPGNVARMIAGQFASADVVAAIEAKLGLHDPVAVQYWRWASKILGGDLGQSMIMERPVGPMLRDQKMVIRFALPERHSCLRWQAIAARDERAEGRLPPVDLVLRLAYEGDGRVAEVQPISAAGGRGCSSMTREMLAGVTMVSPFAE